MLNNKVWVILRPNYGIDGQLEQVGICGSGFFIDKKTFITCYHCLNPSSFTPNESYNNTDLILLSPDQQEERIKKYDLIKYNSCKDLTYIKFSNDHEYFETDVCIESEKNVYNIGYPASEICSLIQANPLKIINQKTQSGLIKLLENNYSMQSNDINIKNSVAIILNYSSFVGYSGGPLLFNNKVIGIMSHRSPKHGGLIAAIASSEFI